MQNSTPKTKGLVHTTEMKSWIGRGNKRDDKRHTYTCIYVKASSSASMKCNAHNTLDSVKMSLDLQIYAHDIVIHKRGLA